MIIKTPNMELLRRTLDVVRDNERWRQESYRCQSGMCFAGWVAAIAGAKWLTLADPTVSGRGEPEDYTKVITPNGDEMQVWDYAQKVLNISEGTADELFNAFNSYETLETMVNLVGQYGYLDWDWFDFSWNAPSCHLK